MMRKQLGAALALFAATAGVNAATTDWTGTGEFGLAWARGNAESETVNARFNFKREDGPWLYDVSAGGLRAKGEVITVNATTGAISRTSVSNANRYDFGGKLGYKFSDRAYFFGAARYDRDDFAPYRWQLTGSAGVGYQFIKNERTTLSAEIGPGWRRIQPVDVLLLAPPAPPRIVRPDKTSSAIARMGANFTHKLTDTTDLSNVLLIESGGGNTFAQNDFGVAVKISERFALKTGLQFRHNSRVPSNIKKTDTLFTTNVVLGF